ncbi:protein disabled isoform X1 [Halyomorpha halys]|uniref:protein disabled isoform X1 n=1 Tax=Halyomorpha halys TaxID=286706 RepID=UPI0006D4D658|nr:protein disabled isoform X1 [Halyomorpha halys]
MSIKKEKDAVNEKEDTTTNQEESKAVSYFKSFMSSNTSASKKEKQDKNEPARFLGDGVSFKAKLIGILEVSEARGDRMCQEALADLKMAIRAAGEHKQRININIAIDGLRLRDEKTGDCLYHHPVHKISFIAQDMSDSRAFGYIFGSPDTGHRFFGIKTDKAASQVVITMRDLFQVVFELKKKEIEMAKQHIEQHQMKFSASLFPDTTVKTSSDTLKIRPTEDQTKGNTSTNDRRDNQEHIMDLLDLELELNNIQQGINQMDRITPSDPFGPSMTPKTTALDPFGDSFNPMQNRTKIPPPPESGKKNKPTERHWFDQETEALFEETELPSTTISSHQANNIQATFPISSVSVSPLPPNNEQSTDDSLIRKIESSLHREQFDVFTDLDPLGTGRSKPYIDKKDFFQDLKNPPKKVLKDLVSELPIDCKHLPGDCDCDTAVSQQNPKLDSSKSVKQTSAPVLYSDPFQSDPFDKDPFSDVDFSCTLFTPSANSDPFEKFADFSSFDVKKEDSALPEKNKTLEDESKAPPLRVSLPPEKISSIDNVPMSPHQSRRTNRLQKNNTISCIIKPPSPVLKRNKLVSQPSLDHLERNSPIMEGVTIRSKTSNFYPSIPTSTFNDTIAPEPPPRSALNSLAMKPPPLPPKRLAISASSKPPPKPPQSDYDYIENYHTTTYTDVNSPPLPAPARKLKPNQQKPSIEPEYYLQPFPLLPPPKKKNLSPKDASSESNASPKHNLLVKSSLDITLSQLTKTGFSDLAATLNMSPTSLSKMTLHDLTKCLANLSSDSQSKETAGSNSPNKNSKASILNSECYSALRESIEEDNVSFTAEFETHFNPGSSFEGKQEESLFDKYAVFRELLEEEKKLAISFNENNSEEVQLQTSNYAETSENIKVDDIAETNLKSEENPVEDRYAALREICLDNVVEEKYDADLSDKEDSVIEPSRLEEDTDLLPQSRPHSESTESPTITMKEHQSIIEATIMEEDTSALEGDEEEVLEESVDETLKESADQTYESIDHNIKTTGESNGNEIFSPVVAAMNESKHSVEIPKNDTSSWAKFDVDLGTVGESRSSIHSEGRASPWSTESKDNDLSPACRDKRKHRKMKRHKQNIWHEDEESEEGWDPRPEHSSWSPSWRENGWSDGDSMYDDTPPYVEREYHSPRRGRRRRVSPWNSRDQSPWEEDDRDICDEQWENSRWQDEPRQRPKHRGPSWEDERRRHYEESRKPRKQMIWLNEVDRKSSRESLTWEDEERYSKRNYGDRRRRKYDDDFHNRNRWREREWSEGGMKVSNRYYKERSHDPHWDLEYSDHADDEISRWPQRPRSCERGRRQFSLHHPAETDFNERSSERRYMRNRDVHCGDTDYRRKAHSHQTQKQRRKHSQNSPFEDDFSSQFGFSKEMSSPGGSDAFELDIKQNAVPFEGNVKQFIDQSKQTEFSQFNTPTTHSSEYNKETAKVCRSYQQSPFEDDFTPPEARRCSGRSASSELSDQRGSDDVFFPNSNENIKQSRSDTIRRPISATQPEINVRIMASKPISTGDQSNSCDVAREFIQTDCDQIDINNVQHINERKQVGNEFKLQGSIKRSDSCSSLRKSESVNIFARNNDPFDDDFFCEESTKNNRSRDKLSRNIISDTKWNESFDTFSFEDK